MKPTQLESAEQRPTPLAMRNNHHLACVEARRCLHCYDAPCIKGCPAGVSIPRFIWRIELANLSGAYVAALENNPFPAICGAVCPTEYLCEKSCTVHGMAPSSVRIGALHHYAGALLRPSYAHLRNLFNGRKVTIVGGGPAGLSCALTLRRLGYAVDLFERNSSLGGMLTHGIPPFRLPSEVIRLEMESLHEAGINFHLGSEVSPAELCRLVERYDAVFLGIGLSMAVPFAGSGTELDGVQSALDFLKAIRLYERGEGPQPRFGQRVVVIGGGNVAMDAASVAKSWGAERVTVLYRRTLAEMPAWRAEYEYAVSLGVEFRWLTGVSAFRADRRQVMAVRTQLLRLGEPDDTGRRRVEPLEGEGEEFPCDQVILAIGQALEKGLLAGLNLALTEGGTIAVNPASFQSTHLKVFAAGDVVNGGTTVVQAIAEGRKAALGIHRFLSGEG
ncbi:MAG: FAD-dependent oxidoreductase [Chloroflexi bacterium]|nr:FAD-dependent oxidoreductase [Chloroflexota bacterium]MCL5074877.1 FAD-dependent oxidoreductase [Chloroflexota bacterium]